MDELIRTIRWHLTEIQRAHHRAETLRRVLDAKEPLYTVAVGGVDVELPLDTVREQIETTLKESLATLDRNKTRLARWVAELEEAP